MGQLDQESDVQDLCAIRKPVVWHRDELHSASLKDHLDESCDISDTKVILGQMMALTSPSMIKGQLPIPTTCRVNTHEAAQMCTNQ